MVSVSCARCDLDDAGVLLPHLADVEAEEISRAGGSVRIAARTQSSPAACPGCGVMSRRVHSRYERRLLDTAIGVCEVVICLAVRRFLCLSPDCAKATFAEQVSGLTGRHARRTPGLAGVLQAVALALGGRAGARLSGRLACTVSRMTLLRLIRARPGPAVSTAPRVRGGVPPGAQPLSAAAAGHGRRRLRGGDLPGGPPVPVPVPGVRRPITHDDALRPG